MNTVSSELPLVKVNLVFESRKRRRLLLVECKWALRYPPEQAATFREDLLQNWDLDAPFFMLAFTNGLYLWKREAPPDALPDFTVSPESIWQAYLASSWVDREAIRAECIEIAMHFWLNDHACGIRKLNPLSEPDRMLEQSGLYEQMRGGTARFDDGDDR
jgi:hypothetical protein